ncbi:MAG: DUF4861 domain-containing protein [Bacteroidales bacterium]|nr:DUF4861 domain-containing protein [Bacteroidales bacterium]
MKRFILAMICVLPFLAACSSDDFTITVINPLDSDRLPEMVETDLSEITSQLGLAEGETFVIKDKDGKEVAYQITSDGKVIFQTLLKAKESQKFTFSKGTPAEVQTLACGKVYEGKDNDLAWENDLIGFRMYGHKEDIPSGYDIFTKRGTNLPVLDTLYKTEVKDSDAWKRYNELVLTDEAAAHRYKMDSLSYHVDHGYGMDCYAVGPTLGAGIAALVHEGEIMYPRCYDTVEFLDNGPLRYRMKVSFKPMQVGDNSVVETRVITLDAGSRLNHTCVSFEGLADTTALVSGIVLCPGSGREGVTDIENGFISYPATTLNVDPSMDVDNGTIFVGHVYPSGMLDAKETDGHLMAYHKYVPGTSFEYFWGAGWNHWNHSDIQDQAEWTAYLKKYSTNESTPVEVVIDKPKSGIEGVFAYIIGLGAAVMMPIIFTILGLCIGIGVNKSLKSGLLVGVGFVGLSVITSLLTSTLGPALGDVVNNYGLQLKVFDMGWPAAASVAYNTSVGAFIIPVCLGVNLLMLLTRTTRTVNIDLWNYWHFAFIGAIVYFAADSILWGFFAAIVCYIITLILADYTADRFQRFYDKMDGISIPQPFCQGFVPVAEVLNRWLDKIPGMNKLNIDAEGMKKKFGLLGEPLFLGIIVGIIIGALSCKSWAEVMDKIPYILGLGIKMGAVMELIPRITSLFIEGLRPISDATRGLIDRKFKGAKGLNIGMSPALVIGHPTTLVVSLLLIPATLVLAVILPGNEFLPLASLAGMFYVFPMILPITKGNVVKTFIIGLILMLFGLLMVTNLAPFFTQAAQDVYATTGDAAVAIPAGFEGGSLDFASSPLAWIIFHLTHSLKWIGVTVLVLFTMFLMVMNRRAISKYQKNAENSDNAENNQK